MRRGHGRSSTSVEVRISTETSVLEGDPEGDGPEGDGPEGDGSVCSERRTTSSAAAIGAPGIPPAAATSRASS
jgi:hypothetical protein